MEVLLSFQRLIPVALLFEDAITIDYDCGRVKNFFAANIFDPCKTDLDIIFP